MVELDFRTEYQKKVAAKRTAIANEYIELRNDHAEVKPWRLFSVIAERYGMTADGIKQILIRAGLYETIKK